MTHSQKRIAINLATPVMALAFGIYKIVSLDAFRHRSGPFSRRGEPKGELKRILVVRLDTIGDVILSEPALRAIKQTSPLAQMDVLVGPSGKAVLAGNPCIDRFIVYAAPWHASWRGQKINWQKETVAWLRTMGQLRRNRYDLAIELRGDPRDIALMALTGAAVKVGSGWRGGSFMLDLDADIEVEAHRVDFALSIAAAAGASSTPSTPRICFDENERQVARSYLPEDGGARYIAMHLGAGFPSKCLPVERFAEVAKSLVQESIEQRRVIVGIGGKDEGGLRDRFQCLFGASPVDLVGKLSLLETAAVLERCALFIGNDSGPMHLAAAVDTPVVTFFGPSEPNKYRPYMVNYRLIQRSLACRPCDHVHCSQSNNICMTEIGAADIIAAAEEFLAQDQMVGERIG
ncbi:MAG: glycosyltransferase family 9 protein [Dehalococcoidia bacterium]|nr:glycosyltransferase family 9 protein [Dehalococcoidia bacterium]